jgi:mannose-1-phosphate guanylyltransferase
MYGVILAGGGGTRLWPQSRARLPKPLMPLLPDGSTMLQATMSRLRPLIPPDRLFIATGAQYADECRRQLPDLPAEHVIIEPSGRDTAPAIGLAAIHAARLDPTGVMGVFPADHIIRDEAGLRADLRLAEQVAERGYLVTLGMKPAYPETGYGYIEVDGPIGGLGDEGQAFEVARFVEKPDLTTATAYVEAGRHLWNAGIFIWRVDVILERYAAQQPEMAARLRAIGDAIGAPSEEETLAREWPAMRKISVDFAIMQEAPRVATITSDIGWSDAGDWNAIGSLLGVDGAGYVGAGVEHLAIESDNCVIAAPGGKLIATIGLQDMVIIDTPDALLVCPRSRTQEVRRIVDTLKDRQRADLL